MENIFRTDLIQLSNTRGRTAGIGEWTIRNGVPAMDIRPEPFYKNGKDGAFDWILKDQFSPGTSYIFDMWIDVDDVIYQDVNRYGGIYIIYTDGTSEPFQFTGPAGWNHKKIITPATKNISNIGIYYYVSNPVYYRWDSYICKADVLNINKNGQLSTVNTIENQNIASFFKGGSNYCNNFYEY